MGAAMIKMMNMAASGGKNMVGGAYHLLCICARSTHYIVRLFATCVLKILWKLLQAQGRVVLALVRKVTGRGDLGEDEGGGGDEGASPEKAGEKLKAQLELVSDTAFGEASTSAEEVLEEEVLEEEVLEEVRVSPLLRQAKLLEQNERPRGDSPPKTGVGSTVVSFDKGAALGYVVADNGAKWLLNTGRHVMKSAGGKKGGWQWTTKAQLVSPRVSPVPKPMPQHLQRHVVCNAQAALDLLMKIQQSGMTAPLHITVK